MLAFASGGGEITYVQFHKNISKAVTEPFPNTGFQITTEEAPPDDPPRNQLERSKVNGRSD